MRATKEAMRYEAGLWTDAVAQLENGAIDIEQVKTMNKGLLLSQTCLMDFIIVCYKNENSAQKPLTHHFSL